MARRSALGSSPDRAVVNSPQQAWLAGYLLVGVLLFATSVTAAQSLRVALSVTPLSAPFVVADERGLFREEGLQVSFTEYVGGHRAAKALFRGEVDVATASETVVMFHSFRRDDFGIVATFMESDNDLKIVATRHSGIVSLQDLAHRRIGTILGSSSQFFIEHSLQMAGVDVAGVEFVGIDPEDTARVLRDGEVDAVASWEPYIHQAHKALGDDARLIPHERLYIETFNILAKREWTARNEQRLRRLLRALVRAVQIIEAEPAASQAMVARRFAKDPKVIAATWGDLRFRVGLSQWLLTTLEAEARWAIRRKLVAARAVPNYLDYLLVAPLEAEYPVAVTVIH